MRRAYYERAQKLLRKRHRNLYLISREMLEGLLYEMAEAARLLERAEKAAAARSSGESFNDVDRSADPRRLAIGQANAEVVRRVDMPGVVTVLRPGLPPDPLSAAAIAVRNLAEASPAVVFHREAIAAAEREVDEAIARFAADSPPPPWMDDLESGMAPEEVAWLERGKDDTGCDL